MKIVTEYYSVSGFGDADCMFLGKRFNEKWGYKPYEGECWAMLQKNNDKGDTYMYSVVGTNHEMKGVWYSEKGNIYTCSADGYVRHAEVFKKEGGYSVSKAVRKEVEGSLTGIWGLNDENVFTWGATWEGKVVLHRWDGKTWEAMPAPRFRITSMHGISPDCIYAAGYDSGIAVWNGKKWKKFKVPAEEFFTSIFVVDKKEQYAVGVNNYVLKGNGTAWEVIALGPGHNSRMHMPLRAVAKWKDQLWIGAGSYGLLRRVEETDQLEVVKSNFNVDAMDARRNLVMACSEYIVESSNGTNFTAFAIDSLAKARKGKKLMEGFK